MERSSRRRDLVELFSTILLAVAALGTAWSTYQSTRWRGEQAVSTSKATAARIESSEAATRAGQLTQIDIATFVQWTDAHLTRDADLAEFYRRRFRPEFAPAFDAWLATEPFTNPDAPLTPFAMPEYRVSESARSSELNAQAGGHSDDAESANERADNYVLAVVMLASALFFAGISTKLRDERQREALLVLGWLVFLGAAFWLGTSPVQIS
jgi:hypothetical protein